jgi:molybdate transport system substrate-binding protein
VTRADFRAMIRLATILVLGACAVASCGGEGDGRPELKVSAAASLKAAMTDYADGVDHAVPRFSFAGSDVLAAQIRAGARPDVYAAASAKLPRSLADEKLVERPVAFARNRLVIAVPAGHDGVQSVEDLGHGGMRLAMGAASVPVGAYTMTVLSRLPADLRARIERSMRSHEPDVSGIVGKLSAGAVDAGFVYASDVRAAGGRLRAIDLPDALEPEVVYEAAVVRGAPHADEARAFVAGLRSAAGQRALRDAGFLPAP